LSTLSIRNKYTVWTVEYWRSKARHCIIDLRLIYSQTNEEARVNAVPYGIDRCSCSSTYNSDLSKLQAHTNHLHTKLLRNQYNTVVDTCLAKAI